MSERKASYDARPLQVGDRVQWQGHTGAMCGVVTFLTTQGVFAIVAPDDGAGIGEALVAVADVTRIEATPQPGGQGSVFAAVASDYAEMLLLEAGNLGGVEL